MIKNHDCRLRVSIASIWSSEREKNRKIELIFGIRHLRIFRNRRKGMNSHRETLRSKRRTNKATRIETDYLKSTVRLKLLVSYGDKSQQNGVFRCVISARNFMPSET